MALESRDRLNVLIVACERRYRKGSMEVGWGSLDLISAQYWDLSSQGLQPGCGL